jgi:hypothetical protein
MRPTQLVKVVRELGLKVLLNQSYYQLLLRSGLAQATTCQPPRSAPKVNFSDLHIQIEGFAEITASDRVSILSIADRICVGEYRPYNAEWQKLSFPSKFSNKHWTFFEHHSGFVNVEDIKDIWEPSRFGWAVWLANAYLLTKNDKYVDFFWEKRDEWQKANPPYNGPNWSSAQEVAIRIMVLSLVFSIFAGSKSSTTDRKNALILSLFQHACRIPPTLSYARAQRNNHLLSEAAGLFTAGFLFSSSPQGKLWLIKGWRIFNTALQDQIDPHGVYIQHSVNYHRLMLQLALWVDLIRRTAGFEWPKKSKEALQMATGWLSEQIESKNGLIPNSGHNDGSDLFPLGNLSISDYRPVLQAASRAFCGCGCLDNGKWDAFSHILYLPVKKPSLLRDIPQGRSSAVYKLGDDDNRGFINIPNFTGRPAHADLLHVDIWKDGQPITLDAGTYRYNAAEPWQNSLARTNCHNTISVDGKDQMTRQSRFLWVDKAAGRVVERDGCRILAEQNGYRKIGLIHQRALAWLRPDTWVVTDALLPSGRKATGGIHIITLHWLVPLAPWHLNGSDILLETSVGKITIQVGCNLPFQFSAISAGEYLMGSGEPGPTLGWYSPTYSQKLPALSLCWTVETPVFPITLTTRFILDKNR